MAALPGYILPPFPSPTHQHTHIAAPESSLRGRCVAGFPSAEAKGAALPMVGHPYSCMSVSLAYLACLPTKQVHKGPFQAMFKMTEPERPNGHGEDQLFVAELCSKVRHSDLALTFRISICIYTAKSFFFQLQAAPHLPYS